MTELGKKNTFLCDVTLFLVGISCRTLRLRRVGFFYTNIRIPKFNSYIACFFVAFMFEELIHVAEDSKQKIKKFIALPEADKSFRFEQVTFQESSSATHPMSTGKDL